MINFNTVAFVGENRNINVTKNGMCYNRKLLLFTWKWINAIILFAKYKDTEFVTSRRDEKNIVLFFPLSAVVFVLYQSQCSHPVETTLMVVIVSAICTSTCA